MNTYKLSIYQIGNRKDTTATAMNIDNLRKSLIKKYSFSKIVVRDSDENLIGTMHYDYPYFSAKKPTYYWATESKGRISTRYINADTGKLIYPKGGRR